MCSAKNYEISQCGAGEEVSCEALAEMMIRLQQDGCHNINFVTPTHIVPQLIKSVRIAAERGLSIPLVYNCGGYESVSTLRLLDGIVDIYMPDAKYGNDAVALALSHAPRYVDTWKSSIHRAPEKAQYIVHRKCPGKVRHMVSLFIWIFQAHRKG